MYRRIFLTSIVLAIVSISLSAQVTKAVSLDNPESRFKTGIQGSYPQHIVESSWWDGAWSPFGTKDIQYFSNGDVKVIESADGSGKLKETYSYSDDGFNYQSITQQWTNGEWENMIRETENMGDDGRYLGYTVEAWVDGAWVLEEGMEHSYEVVGNRAVSAIIRVKQAGSDWKNMQRYTYTYEGNEHEPNMVIVEAWVDGAWVNSTKTVLTYIDSQTTEQIMSMWGDGTWTVYSKMILEDQENGSSSITSYSYVGGDWIPGSRTRYENDTHGNEILFVVEMYADGWMAFMGTQYILSYSGNNLTQRITQESMGSVPGMKTLSWTNTFKEDFSNFHSASTDDLLKPTISVEVYPNPAVENLFVKINNPGQEDKLDVRVYSLSGQLVIQRSLQAKTGVQQQSLSVNDLRAGSYLFQVRNKKGSLFTNEIIHIQ